jgi:hypothetical protein
MMETQAKRPFLALAALSTAQRIAIGCVSLVLGTCLATICIAGSIWVANSAAGTGMENVVLIGAVVLACLFSIGLPVVAVGGIALMRARRFDPIFAPLGWKGKLYAIIWRQYDGEVNERHVSARIIRGPKFYLKVATPLNTDFAIGTRTGLGKTLAGVFSIQQIELEDPACAHLAASGKDKDWVRALLADPTAGDAILRLTQDVGAIETRALVLHSGTLTLHLNYTHLDNITTHNIQSWLDDMQSVLGVAEKLSPPVENP